MAFKKYHERSDPGKAEGNGEAESSQGPLLPDESGEQPESYWVARLEALQNQAGSLPGFQDGRAWEAIGGPMGSWADPLFQGVTGEGLAFPSGGRYKDFELVGTGASSSVYRAQDTLLLRQVAIKVLRGGDRRTLQEARAQAQVEHGNVCRVYEVERNFIVMEYLEGPTLADIAGDLDARELVTIVRDIAWGVQAAHERGLIHLDLKPGNVLMKESQARGLTPIVIDFGMVPDPDSQGPCPLGTPPFTSPEQIEGNLRKLGPWTDIHALGVILYVLYSGRFPFGSEHPSELLKAIALAPPRPLVRDGKRAPEDLERIVQRCLMKDPEARYETAQALALDLDRLLQDRPVLAMGGSWRYRWRKWRTRNAWLFKAVCLGLAGLAVGTWLVVRQERFLRSQAEWDHFFQGIVQDARLQLDHAYRKPVHDITPELQGAEGAQKKIAGYLAGSEPACQGPGRFALAQALFLLDQGDPRVLEDIQAAWDLGFRTESVRSWRVLGFRKSYLATRMDIQRNQTGRSAAQAGLEARRKFLSSVQPLFQGNVGTEEARLAHILAMDDLSFPEAETWDQAAKLQHAYLARFPEDVDAMVDEVDFMIVKAVNLWEACAKKEEPERRKGYAEIERLREEARAVLQKALVLTPSYPRLHMVLALLASDEVDYPTRPLLARRRWLEEARSHHEQGLWISSGDPDLPGEYAKFVGRSWLGLNLQQGLGSATVQKVLTAFVHGQLSKGNEAGVAGALNGILQFSATSAVFGLDASAFLEETTRALKAANLPMVRTRQLREAMDEWCRVGGGFLLESGRDPDALLGLLVRDPQVPIPDTTWSAMVELGLNAAQFNLEAGKAPFLRLDQVQSLLAHPPASVEERRWRLYQLRGRVLGALATGTGWDRVRNLLDDPNVAILCGPQTPVSLELLEAELLVARQDPRQASPHLDRVWNLLQEKAAEELPPFLVNQLKAEHHLLASRQSREPDRMVLEGIRFVEAALAPLEAAAQSKLALDPSGNWDRAFHPRVGRLRLLDAELRLEEAARLGGVDRMKAVRKARASLKVALRTNPNLARLAEPLELRAKGLEK